MFLSAWLSRIAEQLSPAQGLRPLRSLRKNRTSSHDARYTSAEPLESRTLLSNVTIGNINEGGNIVISLPAYSFISNVQILTAANPAAGYMDLGTHTVSNTSNATTITIPTMQDNVDEYDENFVIRIAGMSGSGSGSGSGSSSGSGGMPTFFSNDYYGTIVDDDAAPVLRLQRVNSSGYDVNNNTVPERGYMEPARFQVRANRPTEKPAQLIWGTANGTAIGTAAASFNNTVNNQDFRLLSGQVINVPSYSFLNGYTDIIVGEFTVPINDDRWREASETFSITMTSTLSTLSAAAVTVTITDNEDIPVVFVPSTLSVQENVAVGSLDVPVTLSNPSMFPISVPIETSDGTSPHGATSGEDYVALTTVVTFAAGVTTTNVAVGIINDISFLAGW